MASVTINGKSFSGNNVEVRGKRVTVDGEIVETGDTLNVKIEVHGDLQSFQADSCDQVAVHGKVGSITTVSGSVNCGDVGGAVQTVSGSVNCRDIAGNVSTVSGNVNRR